MSTTGARRNTASTVTPIITEAATIEIITPSSATGAGLWRGLTIAAVGLSCAWTVVQGVDFIRFRVAAEFAASDAARAAALESWSGRTGLASEALEGLLRLPPVAQGTDAVRQRQELLIRLLAIKPLTPAGWLSLAAVRNALAAPAAEVEAAFLMSGLTGPNEGAVMAQRALLGMVLWEKSSPGMHSRTTTDLCGLTNFDPLELRLVLAVKADGLRREIRAALVANGCPDRTMKMIGL